ncbi:MAG: hypothetical protein AAF497_09565, partial [Planctomycetota bacterium]
LAIISIPLMLINWWLINWIPGSSDESESNIRYMWTMIALVTIQAPLVSILITPMLGNAMFLEEVSAAKIWKTVRESWFGLFLIQLLLRGIIFSWILMALVPEGSAEFTGWEVWLILLVLYSVVMRATRPFINEIILLERNPLRSKDKSEMTVGKRSSALHTPNSADLMSRFISCAGVAFFLSVSIIGTLWFMWGMLLFDWEWGTFMLQIVFPASLWLVAGYFAVVRFMCYLDLRIRREGWEVELIMRAAASRLTGIGMA